MGAIGVHEYFPDIVTICSLLRNVPDIVSQSNETIFYYFFSIQHSQTQLFATLEVTKNTDPHVVTKIVRNWAKCYDSISCWSRVTDDKSLCILSFSSSVDHEERSLNKKQHQYFMKPDTLDYLTYQLKQCPFDIFHQSKKIVA